MSFGLWQLNYYVHYFYLLGSPCGKELSDIAAFPGEKDYIEGSVVYNQAFAKDLPGFIAFPETIDEVQKCAQCSLAHSVPFTVKSGGHSNAGYSTTGANGFVISLKKMKNITLSGDTLQVQTGAVWEDVYNKVNTTQYIVTGGMCPSVGVGGFVLGGGYSILSRKYGLAIDNVISFTMVTANGSSVIVATNTKNSDLFWAVLGGGGGNYGIVVDMTFRLHNTLSNFVFGGLKFEGGEKSQEVLALIGRLSKDLPQELYLDMIISENNIHISPVYLGSYNDALKALDPIIHLASDVQLSNYTSYYEVLNLMAEHLAKVSKPEILRGCLLETINEEASKSFLNNSLPNTCVTAFMHLGGAVAVRKGNESAYYYRDAQFDFYSFCTYDNDNEKAEVTDYINSWYDALEQSGICIGNYVNDMDKYLKNWPMKYYGNNYQRLLEIKEVWNPMDSGYYHFLQEIGSSYDPDETYYARDADLIFE